MTTAGALMMTSVVVGEDAPLGRDELRSALAGAGIDTRPVFPALTQYPIWGARTEPQPIARRPSERGMNLPSGVGLRRQQVQRICDSVRQLLA